MEGKNEKKEEEEKKNEEEEEEEEKQKEKQKTFHDSLELTALMALWQGASAGDPELLPYITGRVISMATETEGKKQ